MNRYNFYYLQVVTEGHLDDFGGQVELADFRLGSDFWGTSSNQNKVGILFGMGVTPETPNSTKVVVGTGVAYGPRPGLYTPNSPGSVPHGQRIDVTIAKTVDIALDLSGTSTAVTGGASNKRIVSVFARYKRALSDPRVDGTAATIQYQHNDDVEFLVVQGSEYTTTPSAGNFPALRSDAVLVCDIVRNHSSINGGNVALSDIKVSNEFEAQGRPSSREDLFVVNADPLGAVSMSLRGIRRGQIKDVIADLVGYRNEMVLALTSTAATDGAMYINTKDRTNVISVPAGTIGSQLDAIIAAINTSTAATSINYGGGGNWRDGTTNPATNVELQLDKIVTDLTSQASTTTDGASKIGTANRTNFSGAHLGSTLNDIDSKAVWLAGTQTITGAKTFSATTTFSANALPSGTRSLGDSSNNWNEVFANFLKRGGTSTEIELTDNTTRAVVLKARNAANSAQVTVATAKEETFTVPGDFSTAGSIMAANGYRVVLDAYETGFTGAASGTPTALIWAGGAGTTDTGAFKRRWTAPMAGEITALAISCNTLSGGQSITVELRNTTTSTTSAFTLTTNQGAIDNRNTGTRVFKSGGAGNAFAAGDQLQLRIYSSPTSGLSATDVKVAAVLTI
jgi:hypothetical protein